MLIEFQDYLTFENIYLWTNFGVLPFWLLLIFLPTSKITQFFVNSVIIPLILSTLYIYLIYQAFILDESLAQIFNLYLSIDGLYTIFATENFLLSFWIHFIALNLFVGSWVSKDGLRNNVPKKLLGITLIVIYFAGPVGLVFYWIFRIFYAKRISFHD